MQKENSMKRKHLFLTIVVLLAAGALWFGRSTRRTSSVFHNSSMDIHAKMPDEPSKPGEMLDSHARLAPPDQSRRFRDFTPEQRVEFARKGHGPGG
jgi:hypothetical protein